MEATGDPRELIAWHEAQARELRKRYPFARHPRRLGVCPQCGQLAEVQTIPRVNNTAKDMYAHRCDGCQWANDTYGMSVSLATSPLMMCHPDKRGVIRERVYYGPLIPFAVWADIWR